VAYPFSKEEIFDDEVCASYSLDFLLCRLSWLTSSDPELCGRTGIPFRGQIQRRDSKAQQIF
jgi:hypothetical protein